MKLVCVNPVSSPIFGHVTRGVVIAASDWAARDTLRDFPDDFVEWTGPEMELPKAKIRYKPRPRHEPFERGL